jgi:hypothetical protein
MLWDMIRYENYDETSPYNREAAAWAKNQTSFHLPIDPRPLRDKLAGNALAVDLLPQLATQKKAKSSSTGTSPFRNAPPVPPVRQPPNRVAAAAGNGDVLFIGDSDPIEAQLVPQPRRQAGGDGDVLFIE